MIRMIFSMVIGLAILAGVGGSAHANPPLLSAAQMDRVTAGSAMAKASANSLALGPFFAEAITSTYVSAYSLGITSAATSYSASTAVSY
jgi:hypothetical protein